MGVLKLIVKENFTYEAMMISDATLESIKEYVKEYGATLEFDEETKVGTLFQKVGEKSYTGTEFELGYYLLRSGNSFKVISPTYFKSRYDVLD